MDSRLPTRQHQGAAFVIEGGLLGTGVGTPAPTDGTVDCLAADRVVGLESAARQILDLELSQDGNALRGSPLRNGGRLDAKSARDSGLGAVETDNVVVSHAPIVSMLTPLVNKHTSHVKRQHAYMGQKRGRSTADEWAPGFGDRIARARRELGYTSNAAFAAMLGVTPAAVSQWESELTRPTSPILERLLQCGISQRFIIRNEGEMYTRQITDEDEYRRVLKLRHLSEEQRKFLEQLMDAMRKGGSEDDPDEREAKARPPN